MTTLVALASKHALVMGADSLGTQTRGMVDPMRLIKYFDAKNKYKLKTDKDGAPLLEDIFKLVDESETVPYNQLKHVNKLFRLGNLPIGVSFTGISSIAERTVRGLISEFSASEPMVTAGGVAYTVEAIAGALLKFLRAPYEAAYSQQQLFAPELELLVGGYDQGGEWPAIFRVELKPNSIERVFQEGGFGLALAGQMDWIQRIVFGTDNPNRVRLETRTTELLNRYRQLALEKLESEGQKVDLPAVDSYGEELALFHEWGLEGLETSWDQFSEQNAIDCVDFFLTIMINAQDVGPQLPTVGGNVHIAVIRKDGFFMVSKEVWRHGDHEIQIPEVGT